jgi:DHA2 family methylenomycin A resistance protein-like MFS transporter
MTSYPDARARARAVAVWGAGSGLGVAIGPVLGGIVVSALGWRWAFGIDVLAAAALVVASVRRVPRDVPARPQHAFDALGAVLAAAGMAGVVFVLIEGPQRGWASVPVLAAIAASVVIAVVFVRIERRHPAPLVDLALVRNRRFAGANVAAAALMFVLLASTVYVSQFLQSFRSLSALEAGLALLPVGAGTAVLASISGRLTASVAPRRQIQAGLLCAVAGTILLATVSAGSGPLALAPGLLLLGMGAGIALPATTATAVSSVTGARAGMASAIHNAGRQVGATLGVAVLGSIVLTYGANHTAGAYAHGLSVAMIAAAAALTGVAIIETRLLHPRHDARSKSAA